MGKLPAIRIGHLRILDHLILGVAGDSPSVAMVSNTAHPMRAVPMGSWNQIRQSFCDGELHGAFMPLPEAMQLFDSGMDIKILLLDGRSGASVVGNRDASVDKLIDFKGKTVLISSYLSVLHLLFYRLMASAGLKAGVESDLNADVYIEIVPPFIVPEMVLNDHSGELGGCFIEEPFGSLLVERGLGRAICPSARLWPDHPGSVLVVHDYLIRDYPRQLMDVIYLLVRSNMLLCRSSEPLYRLSLDRFFDQEMPVVDKLLTSLPERPRSLMPDIQSIEIINRFMVKDMGIMNNIINAGDLVDTSFAIEAGA